MNLVEFSMLIQVLKPQPAALEFFFEVIFYSNHNWKCLYISLSWCAILLLEWQCLRQNSLVPKEWEREGKTSHRMTSFMGSLSKWSTHVKKFKDLSLFFFLSLSHASQEKYKKKEYGLLISIMVILFVILCPSCRWIAWTCYWEEHYQELPHGWKTGDCKWIAKYYSWI